MDKNWHGHYYITGCLGLRIMENQMRNELETGIPWGFTQMIS